MKSVLVPVGISPNSRYAVQRVASEFLDHPGLEVHLLNVRTPLPRHIAQFLRQHTRSEYHRERAEVALKPAREILERHNIPYQVHVRMGDKGTVIAAEAKRLGCDHIVMSTARKNSLTRMLEDSTTNRVLELTQVPVELVAGDAVSRLERYGVPAGIGTALALLIAEAMD